MKLLVKLKFKLHNDRTLYIFEEISKNNGMIIKYNDINNFYEFYCEYYKKKLCPEKILENLNNNEDIMCIGCDFNQIDITQNIEIII